MNQISTRQWVENPNHPHIWMKHVHTYEDGQHVFVYAYSDETESLTVTGISLNKCLDDFQYYCKWHI